MPSRSARDSHVPVLMAITRSMSGATKKTVPDGLKQQKPKPNAKGTTMVRTIMNEAFGVFMMKDYVKRFSSEPRPLSESKLIKIGLGGHAEWAKMNNADKDVWIEYTKKRKAEGFSVSMIRGESD